VPQQFESATKPDFFDQIHRSPRLVHDRLFFLGNYEGQVRNEPFTVNDAPALAGLPPDFFANNPDLQNQVAAASGSFPRSFNQNTAFIKLSGVLTHRNTFSATYNYERFRSPHGYFNTRLPLEMACLSPMAPIVTSLSSLSSLRSHPTL